MTDRMGIIDRYVLRLYFRVLFIAFICLTGLFIIVDAFNNLEEFITYSKATGSPLLVLGEYYGARALWFFDRMSGVMGMAAAMFTLAMMRRNNELTPLMAAGISSVRLVKPLLGATIVVGMLGLLNRELGLPNVRDKLTRNAQDWMGDVAKKCHPKYDPQTDILLTGKHAIAKDKRIENPQFRLPPEMVVWGKMIAAENAFFEPAAAGKSAGYRLVNVSLPEDLAKLPSFKIDDRTVLHSPADTPWLKENECFVASEVTFEQLYVGNGWRQYLSTAELVVGLKRRTIENGADVQVTLHSRLLQPLMDIVLLFLGVPLVLNAGNRNIFYAIGQCVGTTFGFFIVTLAAQSLGSNYILHPVLAAWIPMLTFAPLAYVFARPLWD